jgi:hypothetical protein
MIEACRLAIGGVDMANREHCRLRAMNPSARLR